MKRILADILIREAPLEEDMKHNSDLMTLSLYPEIRVACRVRNLDDLIKHPDYEDEFTMRQDRPSGAESELRKLLMHGWGHFIIYGFGDFALPPKPPPEMVSFLVGDLKVLREWYFERWVTDGTEPGRRKHNTDDSSTFRIFRIADLPPRFIVRRQLQPLQAGVLTELGLGL